MDSVSRMRSRTFVVQVRVFLQVMSCTRPSSGVFMWGGLVVRVPIWLEHKLSKYTPRFVQ